MIRKRPGSSVMDMNPVSGDFSPGSETYEGYFRIPGPGSRIADSDDNFWGKKYFNSSSIGSNFFLRLFKGDFFNFVKFVASNKVRLQIPPPSSFCGLRDPGSQI